MRKIRSMSEDTMIENLEETLQIQSVSGKEEYMNTFIIEQIKYDNEDVTIVTEQQAGGTNIYVTKGKADVYPCVVAHTDTVHNFVPGYGVCKLGDKFYAMDSINMQQVGVGGDDKVGIWAALECIKKFDNIKAAYSFLQKKQFVIRGEELCIISPTSIPQIIQLFNILLLSAFSITILPHNSL